MNRCPKCESLYPDTEHFCERDGTPLTADSDDDEDQSGEGGGATEERSRLVVGAGIGIIGGMLLFLIYFALTREPSQKTSDRTATTSNVSQAQFPVQPQVPTPSATVEPSPSPSPSPSVEPTPSPASTPERVELSSNPISTASGANGKTGPVSIKLTSGITIEADEAWQTGEGIWYRRGGVVSLVDPKDIRVIEKLNRTQTSSPTPPKP